MAYNDEVTMSLSSRQQWYSLGHGARYSLSRCMQAAYMSPNEGGSGAAQPLLHDFVTLMLGWTALGQMVRAPPPTNPPHPPFRVKGGALLYNDNTVVITLNIVHGIVRRHAAGAGPGGRTWRMARASGPGVTATGGCTPRTSPPRPGCDSGRPWPTRQGGARSRGTEPWRTRRPGMHKQFLKDGLRGTTPILLRRNDH